MVLNIPKAYLDGTEINNGGTFNFADELFDVSRINAILRIIHRGGG